MSGRRRVATLFILAMVLLAGQGFLGAAPASAHPMGNFTVNLYSGLELSPETLRVRYVLDMAEIPTFQEGARIDTSGDGIQSPAERRAWAEGKAAELVMGLTLLRDGRSVPLWPETATVRSVPGQAGLPTLRLEATFSGSLGESGTVTYRDGNYPNRAGWKEITVSSTPGVVIANSSVPSASISRELLAYPQDLLASPLQVTSARFSFRPGESSRAPQAIGPGRSPQSPGGLGASFAALVGWRLTPPVLMLSLLLAFLFGVIHALLPGHGKALTAVYLVGSQARVRTAVAAGLAVSFMHTVSVLALGVLALLVVRSLAAERVYAWLGLATGLVAFGLGAGMLAARLLARSRGSDSAHGHAHRSFSRPGFAALAVAGGMLPSPTAIVVLTGAVSYDRIEYGLALIVAFSLGLAASLIVVGLLALRARSMVTRIVPRWAGMIPPASALAIMILGAFFAVRGIVQVV
ncbi:MAG: nickel/cobalt transporter [Actinomycetota bacterium]